VTSFKLIALKISELFNLSLAFWVVIQCLWHFDPVLAKVVFTAEFCSDEGGLK